MPPDPGPASKGPHDAGTPQRVQELARLIRTLSVESQRLAQSFADGQQLHATDMEALIHVMEAEREGEPLTPGQLATELGLSGSATTSVIDRMEGHRHVRRERDPHDRRRVNLRVDDEALAVSGRFFGPLGQRTGDVLAPFSDAELDGAARVMTALIGAIRDHRLQLTAPPDPKTNGKRPG